ncbi:hypothetical protein [Vulcanibacillus modesticaldus]|uniref:hypothetical protein n=1 Tax=Vulcanibacillus modesticaldus TaxID=337097 RepID=UPI00159F08B2|nr:hypothetical protein [Vulcanibacillus modesticaldus]
MTIAMYELNERELLETNGGGVFLVAVAAVTAAIVLFNAAEAAGESIGRAIYYATH